MPNIREFDTGNLALRPSETGVDARAQAARRISASFNQVAGTERQLGRDTEGLGEFEGRELRDVGARAGSAIAAAGDAAVMYETHHQISQGAASFAQYNRDKNQQWNDTIAHSDVNDPTVAQKFLNEMEPELQKFKDSFLTEAGQNWAEQHVDAFRAHMFEKTTGDMSRAAGEAVKINAQQTINSLSVMVHGDPSSLDYSLDSLKSASAGVVASSPNLSGVDRAVVHQQIMQHGAEAIVKSAAIGYIEKTGQMPPWASDPKYSGYINGAELKQFEMFAKAQQRAALIQQKQIELYNIQQQDHAARTALNKSFTDNVTVGADGRVSINPNFVKDLITIPQKFPDAQNAASEAKTYIDWTQAQQRERREVINSDPAVRSDLMTRMFDPNKPTTEVDVLRAEADHKLDSHDASTMRALVKELEESPLKGPVMHDTIEAAKDELVLSGIGIPGKDIQGEANFAKFMQTFVPEYLKQYRAGTLSPDALDVKNPDSLISKAMAPFKRTTSQRISDYVSSLGGTGAPAAPAPPQQVTTQAQYNALPSGTIYTGRDGKQYRKP